MFDRLRSFFQTRSNPIAQAVYQLVGGMTQYPDHKYESRAREGYQANATVFACIREIATACGGIPWILYRKAETEDTKNELIADHDILGLLRRPGGRQGGSSFVQNHFGYLMIDGNAFIAAAGPKGKVAERPNGARARKPQPTELWNLRPDRISIDPDRVDDIKQYIYLKGQAGEQDFTPDQLLHRKFFHPTDDWRGLSPLQVVGRDVDHDNAARQWNYSLAKNGGRVAGAFKVKKALGPTQKEKLKAEIHEEISGPDNAGRILLIEGEMDWLEMAHSMVDADWGDGRRLSMLDICKGFGVPPEIVGDSEHKIYNNYREARKSFYEETILPLMDSFRDDLNIWLVDRWDDRLFLDYDRDEIEALQETQEILWGRAERAWFLTLDERRDMIGYPTFPGGNVLFVPAGLVPIPVDSMKEALALPEPEDDAPDDEDKDGEEEDF